MLGLIWFFRIISFPLGLVCVFVSLDMLYIWGFDGSSMRRSRYPQPTRLQRPSRRVDRASQRVPSKYRELSYRRTPSGYRPHPYAWVWWEWQIRRPAFYLFFLGTALVTVGALTWWPGFGSIPWVSDHIEGIAMMILGLILLRGTLKISSPVIWRRVTIIKRPLSGSARPSLLWMGMGLVLCIAGLYGLVCDYAAPADCIGGDTEALWELVFTLIEFVLGGVSATGLEEMAQSWQEGEPPIPRSLWLFGIGLVCFAAALIGRATLL